jgi:site-specific DNA-methyltransferase (adenine-specific)
MNYANKGDKILDTHLGSGSSAIAADKLGLEFVGLEINPTYFDNAVERVNNHISQIRMF